MSEEVLAEPDTLGDAENFSPTITFCRAQDGKRDLKYSQSADAQVSNSPKIRIKCRTQD